MSEKRYAASVVAIAVIAALLTVAVAACSSATSAASVAASAAATSSAVAKAKDQVNVCVQKMGGATGLLDSAKRNDFIDCMKNLVPADKSGQFKNCLTSAATSDKIWTSDGFTKFTSESIPSCVDAASA